MPPDFDPIADRQQVDRSLKEFQSFVDRLGAALNTRVPDVSGWSAAQHLFHVTLATDLGLGNVLALRRGKGVLIREDGELHPETRAILLSPEIPRGQADAPRMVRPPEIVEASQITTELQHAQHSLLELDNLGGSLADCPGWIQHQVLGPLQAVHWMRFCALHAEHHAKIVREIEAHLDS